MPVAKDQTMFPMELCRCHNKPSTLLRCFSGAYRWRCLQGTGPAWVTIGSQMDVYNKLVDPRDETSEYIIDSARLPAETVNETLESA